MDFEGVQIVRQFPLECLVEQYLEDKGLEFSRRLIPLLLVAYLMKMSHYN